MTDTDVEKLRIVTRYRRRAVQCYTHHRTRIVSGVTIRRVEIGALGEVVGVADCKFIGIADTSEVVIATGVRTQDLMRAERHRDAEHSLFLIDVAYTERSVTPV